MHGGLHFGGFNPALDYGDEYGAEENNSEDKSSRKYLMLEGKRYQKILNEAATAQIEKAYQDFVSRPGLSTESYFEVNQELYYLKFNKHNIDGALKHIVTGQVKNTGTEA